MVATTVNEIAELEEACFEVARTTKWTRRPIDADDICRHAQRLFEIAREEVYEPLGRDAALITRAVHYLGTAHAIPPMDENTEWFAQMLSAVVEVARPNSFHEGKGQEFLKDMLEGIQSRLES
jgi:hypothetical protein